MSEVLPQSHYNLNQIPYREKVSGKYRIRSLRAMNKATGRPFKYDFKTKTIDITICGDKGGGKTAHSEYIAFDRYMDGSKPIDFYNCQRQEHDFRTLPTEHGEAVPTETYVPYDRVALPKELPDFYKVFTLPIPDLSLDEFDVFLPSKLRQDDRGAAHSHREELYPDENIVDLVRNISESKNKGEISILGGIVKEKVSNRRSYYALYNALGYLLRKGTLTSSKCPLNIDLEKILKDNKTFTGFSFAYTDEYYKFAVLSYFIRKYREVKLKIKHPCVFIVKEAGDLIPRTPQHGAQWQFTRDYKRMQTSGRDYKTTFIFDTQYLEMIDETCISLCEYITSFQNSSNKDHMTIRNWQGREAPDLRSLKVGEAFVFKKNKERWGIRTNMPPHEHKTEGSNFNEIWAKSGGDFVSTKEAHNIVRDEYGEAWDKLEKKRKVVDVSG